MPVNIDVHGKPNGSYREKMGVRKNKKYEISSIHTVKEPFPSQSLLFPGPVIYY